MNQERSGIIKVQESFKFQRRDFPYHLFLFIQLRMSAYVCQNHSIFIFIIKPNSIISRYIKTPLVLVFALKCVVI